MKKFIFLLIVFLFAFFSNAFSQQTVEIFEPQKYGLREDCVTKIDPIFLAMFGKSTEFIEKSKSITPIEKNYRGEIVLSAIIKTNNISELKAIEGVVVGSIHGDIVTATFEFNKLVDIANLDSTIYIEASIFLHYNLDESVPDTKADSIWIPQGGYISTIKGESVLIGIMDSGIDWNHKDFIDNDELYPSNPANWQTRIMYIWDQYLTNDPHYSVSSPDGYTYGLEYSSSEIDQAIQGGDTLATNDTGGHGTHVAGIAAGDGTSTDSTYIGMAPESRLIVCKYNQTTASALDGFDWMIYKASESELNMPIVINFSQGSNLGPHDGTTNFEQSINYDIQNYGLNLVVSAGNSRSDREHAQSDIPTNSHHQFEVHFDVYQPDLIDRWIQFWYEGCDSFTIRIRPNVPTVGWCDPVPIGTTNMTILFGIDGISGQITISHLTSDENEDKYININVNYLGGIWPLHSLTWYFDIIDLDTQQNEVVHGYIYSGTGAEFTNDYTMDGTICMPGSASDAISVSSYNTKLSWLSINGWQSYQNPNPIGYISDFSSKGPLRNETSSSKPDITAPGKGIGSSFSSNVNIINNPVWNNDWILDENPSNQHAITQGTSMSAPHVTGACALLLQKFPYLTCSDLKTILKENANSSYPSGDEKDWGSGKLDILEAYKSMVGFDYTKPYQYDEDKFKDTFEEHEDIAGLPIEPVQIDWNGVNYFKQKLTNGALFLDQSGLNEAFWIGENIWNSWMCPSSIGLPISSQYLDFQNNLYQTVDFENGRIYYDWANTHTVYLRAEYDADNRFGTSPLEVNFTDLSVGSITSWEWDFDSDGTIDSYEQNPTYTYNLSGVYSVSLKINDGNDIDWEIKSQYIEVYGLGNFTEVRLTNDNSNSEWPAIDFDNSNNASIVWQDYRDGNWEIYFCRIDENNNILVSPTRITQTGSNSIKPDVGVDNAGNSYVVWEESGSIRYCKIDSSGNKIVDDITIDGGSLPAISTLADGTSGIAWEKSGMVYKTQFEKRNSSGNLIGNILILNSICFFVEKNCYIDKDDQNNFYVWRLELGNWFSHYYHIAKITSSNSIAYNGAFLQASDDSKECCLGITQEDNAYLFYVDYTDGYYQIYDGSQNPQSSGNGNSRYPSMSTKPQNRSFFTLVWEDNRNGNWEVYFNKYDDNNFIADQILNNDNEHSRHPDVACNSNGKWSIVWEDYKDGNSEIYYMKLDYVPPTSLEAPENVIISTSQDSVYIDWESVQGATFYKVYSTDNPSSGFTVDDSGIFDGCSWKAPLNTTKRFYYVTSDNCRKNINPKSRKLNDIIHESYLDVRTKK